MARTQELRFRIIAISNSDQQSSHRIIYAAFDRFPSSKGAATHIDAFVSALGNKFGNVNLLTIQSETEELQHNPADRRPRVDWTPEPNWNAKSVAHHPLAAYGNHLFERTLSFRREIESWWQNHLNSNPADVFHFRSIFEGYPIALNKDRYCRNLVFEVNGLPSIELKYRYPATADDRELLQKLRHQEQVCLDAADVVITVSQVNADHLMERGVAANRIHVIRNGVDLDIFQCRSQCPNLEDRPSGEPIKLLYCGTMSAWQGVSHAIEAVTLLRRDHPATLTLVGPARPRERREIQDQCWKAGVAEFVTLRQPVPKLELLKLHHQADVVLAPITRNDRNLVQGCCPLKVLEAMASGTPLIASDLPVVRELVSHDEEALLVRPGSGKAIKDGVLRLLNEPNLANSISTAAAGKATAKFPWSRAQAQLIAVYESLLNDPESNSSIKVVNRAASASS
ncbi:MAG: glycosyltransferase family 4 protein [Fuerstiella sp.]